MWNERRMRSGPGQTSAGAARCTRCDRRGSARSSAVDSTWRGRAPAGAQAAGSSAKPLRGITSIPARMSSATGRGRESRPGRLEPSASNAITNRNRSCRPLGEGQATTEIPDRRGAFLTTTDPWVGLRPRPGGGTPRAIARKKVRAIGSAMWLVRCFSRRRSQRIPTPTLDWSRQPPWELVPGSPLPVRPSNVAGG